MRHSPTPWELGMQPGTDCDVDDSGRNVGWHTGTDEWDRTVVRDLKDGTFDIIACDIKTIDDARLIAAAPELLEALKPFANFACDEPCGCNNCRARAAIAKAEGRGQ